MDDLRSFWTVVADELATRCGTDSTALDAKIVQRREETEGQSLWTLTLPAFCKDFERSLDQGALTPNLFQGWRKFSSTTDHKVMPQFLGGFMSQIFSRDSGLLLDEPEIDAIFAVRQLTLMYSKILLPCTSAREKEAISSYVQVEQEMRRLDAERPSSLVEEFRKASTVLWGTVLQQVDEDIYYGRIVPRHGPGATADRLKGNRKFDQREWTERLQGLFSWDEFMIPNHRYSQEYLPQVQFLDPEQERPVRVVLVPKTAKRPRVIAIEPTCMQYVQQGLMARFVEYTESPYVLWRDNHNVGYGVIGFTDQEPNQLLAREGSLTGDLATLDLSEASDRVSNQLVREMLRNFPHLQEGVEACRSRKADVPGFGVIPLSKFASMGSALTFPIEAMVFSTAVMMGIARELNKPVDTDLILRYRSRVRVYGDDIIVPVRFVHRVVTELEALGFKVNVNKSFWTGKFRESCGREFYDGHDVSVMKVRREFPTPTRTRKAKEIQDGCDAHSSRDRGNDRQPARRLYSGRRPGADQAAPGEGVLVPEGRGHTNPGAAGDRERGRQCRRPLSHDERLGQAQELISLVSLRNQAYLLGLWRTAGHLDVVLLELLDGRFPTVQRSSAALGRWSLLDYQVDKLHPRLHAPMVKAYVARPKTPASRLSNVGALLKCLLLKGDLREEDSGLAWLDAITGLDAEHLDRAGRDQTVRIMSGWVSPF